MDKKIVSVTQQHINTAIAERNWNSTPSMLACREAGLDSSVGFDNEVAVYLYTNEDEKHPNYGSDPNDKSKLSADCRLMVGACIIAGILSSINYKGGWITIVATGIKTLKALNQLTSF